MVVVVVVMVLEAVKIAVVVGQPHLPFYFDIGVCTQCTNTRSPHSPDVGRRQRTKHKTPAPAPDAESNIAASRRCGCVYVADAPFPCTGP